MIVVKSLVSRRSSLTFAAVLSAATLFAGCAAVVIDGKRVNESAWEEAKVKILPSASFSMNCPQDQLKMVPLDLDGPFPRKVGVGGCDRKQVYVWLPNHTWVVNTDSSSK